MLLTEVWPSGRELSEPDAEGGREIKKPECMCEGLAVTSQKAQTRVSEFLCRSRDAVHGEKCLIFPFFPHSSHILTAGTLNAFASLAMH